MLQVILSALLLTGFCACLEMYHEELYDDYKAALEKEQTPLSYTEISNEDNLEYFTVHRSYHSEFGLHFEKIRSPEEKSFYFRTESDETYKLASLLFHFAQAEVKLYFVSPETTAKLKVVANLSIKPARWTLGELFKEADKHTFHVVNLMTTEETDNVLKQIDTPEWPVPVNLNNKWIQQYFEKAKPLYGYDELIPTYIGLPLLMDKGDIRKLTNILEKLPVRNAYQSDQ